MSLKGLDALRRRVGSIKQAIEHDIFEEAGREWVEQDFVPAAQAIVHVESGELRDSIGGEVNSNQIRVFASAPHAIHEEEGTVLHEAHPFMKPAYDQTRKKLSARTRKKLRDKLK